MEWIPITERLPELHREQYVPHPYLKQASINDYYLMSEPVLVSRECEEADWRIAVAQYEDDLDGRTYWETVDAEILTGVTAWMPLPKPYNANDGQTDCSWK